MVTPQPTLPLSGRPPAAQLRPKDAAELLAELRRHADASPTASVHVSTTRRGQSHASLGSGGHLAIDLGALRAVRRATADADRLHAHAEPELFRVGAGATFADLHREMAPFGRMIHNQPGYQGMSFVGVAATGSMGGGLFHAPIARAIRSMDLLVPQADGWVLWRVEPSDGPTDPARYPGVLWQNDAWFDAARVAVGGLGVITSVLVRSEPIRNLREERTRYAWSQIQDRVCNPDFHACFDSVDVWLDPYSAPDARGSILYLREDTGAPVNLSPRHALESTTPLFVLDLAVLLVEHLPIDPSWILVPSMVTSTTRSHASVRHATEARDFEKLNLEGMQACGVVVPLEAVPEAVRRIQEGVARAYDDGRRLMTPVGLRFCGPDPAPLAPQKWQHNCFIEITGYRRLHRLGDTLFELFHDLVRGVGARPHLGLFTGAPEDAGCVRAALGDDLAAFDAVRRQFDPGRTLRNPLLDALIA